MFKRPLPRLHVTLQNRPHRPAGWKVGLLILRSWVRATIWMDMFTETKIHPVSVSERVTSHFERAG